MTPEGKVKAKVNKALKPFIDAGKVWKFMPVQMGMGIQGLDYFLCVGGTFVAIETKVKDKEMTTRQETIAEEIRAAGGQVYMVNDEDSLALAIAKVSWLCQ